MRYALVFSVLLSFFLPNAGAYSAPEGAVIEKQGLFKMRRVESPEEKGFRYVWATRWRTDNELLIDAEQYQDRKAQGAWNDLIFRWDIDTGAITGTPYVGRLSCMTADRLAVTTEEFDPADPGGKKRRKVYSGAAFWQPARRIGSDVFNEYSCKPMERRITRDFGPDTYLMALLPGHGKVLRETRPLDQSTWFLRDGSTERIQIGAGVRGGSGEEISNLANIAPAYLPWLGEYLFFGFAGDHRNERMWTYDVTLYFLSPDGRIETRREPAPINAWKKQNRLSVSIIATKAGVVWSVADPGRSKPSEFDGLYIERDGTLVRFLHHARLAQAGVSPGGCRALTTIDPSGRNFPQGGKTELHMIDFCEEAKQ